jgi:hypothetical protein
LSENDPTDHALAAIASILDKPESLSFRDAPAVTEKPAENPAVEPSGPVEADGYSKTGPGPLQAIRFKWTVRRDDKGDYYVDETIGENSVPISSGPMPKDAAIQFVDERENEARRRFEGIKREMAARDVSG